MAIEISQEMITKGIQLLEKVGYKLIMIILAIAVGYILIKIITRAVAKFFDKVDFDRAVEIFIENTISVVLWIIFVLVILANMGVDVSGLIAGLGIAGFVIGFALKDTLGNLASGVFLLFHKPFKLNDYVDAAGVQGIVQSIGVAACTLKTPDNKKITVPNSAIWGAPITNFTGLKQRRMEIEIGISYGSNMNKAIKIVDDILKKDKRVLKEPAHQVVIAGLGDSSVNMKIRPWVKIEDYWDLNFYLIKTIKEQFDKKKIEIPFPQRDVHLKKK